MLSTCMPHACYMSSTTFPPTHLPSPAHPFDIPPSSHPLSSHPLIHHFTDPHLSPVLEEVGAKDVLLGVVVFQHPCKEAGRLLSLLGDGHGLAIIQQLHFGGQALVGRGKVWPLVFQRQPLDALGVWFLLPPLPDLRLLLLLLAASLGQGLKGELTTHLSLHPTLLLPPSLSPSPSLTAFFAVDAGVAFFTGVFALTDVFLPTGVFEAAAFFFLEAGVAAATGFLRGEAVGVFLGFLLLEGCNDVIATQVISRRTCCGGYYLEIIIVIVIVFALIRILALVTTVRCFLSLGTRGRLRGRVFFCLHFGCGLFGGMDSFHGRSSSWLALGLKKGEWHIISSDMALYAWKFSRKNH